uniref:PIH1 domain-containing protein n=1 Tax=Panagrellus redivivus TaxID=6233 RepID=A0A7E4VIR3_PANRE
MSESFEQRMKERRLLVDTPKGNEYILATPAPGAVLKFKDARLLFSHDDKVKCFVNLCHCNEMLPPDLDEDDEKLQALLRVDNKYHLPISLGQLDCIKDKSGQNSIKFDAMINSTYYHRRWAQSEFHTQLIITAITEKIESVHQIRLKPALCIILKNKTWIGGEVVQHTIPKNPKNPLQNRVIDLTDVSSPFNTHQHENVNLWIEKGTLLKAQIKLGQSGVKVSDLKLQANEDHIVVLLKPGKRIADFFVPVDIDVESLSAQIIDGGSAGDVLELQAGFTLVHQG